MTTHSVDVDTLKCTACGLFAFECAEYPCDPGRAPNCAPITDDLSDDEPCRECGAVPGTSEYGTAGDGYDGLCPSCADEACEPESKPLKIKICSRESRASMCLANGESVLGSEYERDVFDCVAAGDCQPACEYVRDHIGVEFRIVARNAAGEYENRLATAVEKEKTARMIYFESESDFSDESLVETYLIWQAAADVQSEESA